MKTKTQEYITEWINNNEEKWNRMTEAEKALKKEKLSLVFLKDKTLTEQLKEGFAENDRIIRKAEIDRAKVRMCNLIANDQFVLALDIMKEHVFQLDLKKERERHKLFVEEVKKDYPILRKECLDIVKTNLDAISELTRICLVLENELAFSKEEVAGISKMKIQTYVPFKEITGNFVAQNIGIQLKNNSLQPLDWQYMGNQYVQLTALIDLAEKLIDKRTKKLNYKS